MKIRVFFVLVALMSGGGGLGAGEIDQTESYRLVCHPIETVVPLGWGPNMRGPRLAVVDTEIRPGRTRLYLDGRLIGMAKHFDGHPGELFLEPGRYRLEARLGGYGTTVFEIDASADCFFQVKHRMTRNAAEAVEERWGRSSIPKPDKRVFGSIEHGPPTSERDARRAGPDPRLRPDLASVFGLGGELATPAEGIGCLSFDVKPEQSAIYLDGAFVATVEELNTMVEPLAVESGAHVVEVVAPGHTPERREIVVGAGATVNISLALQGGAD